MSDGLSISQAESYLRQLRELRDELKYAEYEFDRRLEKYRNEVNPETRINLQSSIAQYEKYILPFAIAQQKEETPIIENADSLTLNIDGYWGAYEFRQLFDGIDYLNKLYTVRSKLEGRSQDFRVPNSMTRSSVYRKARLSYYLSTREELRVKRIQFASPGSVNFEGVGDVIKEIRETFDYIITGEWVKRLIKNYYEIRNPDLRKAEERTRMAEYNAQHAEAVLREIEARSKIKAAIQKTRTQLDSRNMAISEETQKGLQLMDKTANLIIRLEVDGLASMPVVEDSLMHTISQLHRLSYEEQKVLSKISRK